MSTKFLFMKKLINVFTLIACFSFLATSSNAQTVRNDIGCSFIVEVTYAKIGDCAPEGSVFVPVSAFSNTPITGIPAGYEMIQARGASSTFCGFGVGGACSAFDVTDVVNCSPGNLSTACDNYTVDYVSSLLVRIHH